MSRELAKEARRRQLIEATIDGIARKGFTELKIADVAAAAGLDVDELLRERGVDADDLVVLAAEDAGDPSKSVLAVSLTTQNQIGTVFFFFCIFFFFALSNR